MFNTNQNQRGSILIWTVSIGLALSTAFFFLATRLGLARDTQQESVLYFSQRAYLETYVDYLAGQSPYAQDIDFDGISGRVEKGDTIEGVLDINGSSPDYDLTGDLGTVTVSWNTCDESGDLLINGILHTHSSGPCTAGAYDDSFNLLLPLPASLQLTAASSPLHYRIARSGPDKLVNARWQIHASIPLKYGKKITIKRPL